MLRFLAGGASFGLPGLGHVLSGRTLAAFAWMCIFFATALGMRLSVLPAASEASGLIAHVPFWHHRSCCSFALPQPLNCCYAGHNYPRAPANGGGPLSLSSPSSAAPASS